MRHPLVAVWLVAATTWLPGAAIAQEVRVTLGEVLAPRTTPPPTLAGEQLTLAEAVGLAIRHNPAVGRSVERARQAGGEEQEARGAFDASIAVTPALSVVRQAFPPSLWSSFAVRGDPFLEAIFPGVEQRDQEARIGCDIVKVLRAGPTVSGGLLVSSHQYAYADGPASWIANFETSAQFRSSISLTLDVPLRKGGRASLQAPERAAAQVLAGQHEALRHGVAEAVLDATLAYLHLAAAQERVRLLGESAERQQEIVHLTEGQIEIGDVPAFEANRARGRAAQVAGLLGEGRVAVIQARAALAAVIGIEAGRLAGTPLAAERLAAEAVVVPAPDVLMTRAAALRRDLRWLAADQAAAAALELGARADLRPRIDVSVTAGVGDLYDGARARGSAPLDYTSPAGFSRAFTGRWQPFAAVGLRIELPFANNLARGQLLKAQARSVAARVEAADLERVIRHEVLRASGEIGEARAAMEQYEAAVRHGTETLAAAMAQLKDREMTLIDALLTEEEVTSDALQFVDQRLRYLSALARLRFETGELVAVGYGQAGEEVLTFTPAGLVER